jgi:hypothetical protein
VRGVATRMHSYLSTAYRSPSCRVEGSVPKHAENRRRMRQAGEGPAPTSKATAAQGAIPPRCGIWARRSVACLVGWTVGLEAAIS